MIALLRGIGVPPGLVGALRGIIEAGLLAMLGEAAVLLPQLDWGDLAIVAGPAFGAIRLLEGLVDHIDPAKQRIPPAP